MGSSATIHHPAHTCVDSEELGDMLHAEQEAHASTRASLVELAQQGEAERESLRQALARICRRACNAADEYRTEESVPGELLAAVLTELELVASMALKGSKP